MVIIFYVNDDVLKNTKLNIITTIFILKYFVYIISNTEMVKRMAWLLAPLGLCTL